MKDTIIEHMGQVIGTYRTDARRKGHKEYEIKDHLGNVRAVISDVKNPLNMYGLIDNWRFTAEILNLSNYYPYGLQIPTGFYSSNADYTYGYNSMEKDDELKSGGKLYSTLFREGDTENGRWWSRDPEEMNMPYQSSYILMDGNPIRFIDPNGDIVKSSEEDFEAENEGLEATLGEDHPFSYDEASGTWAYDKDYDISHYNDTQKEVYERTVAIIEDPLVIQYILMDPDETFTFNFSEFQKEIGKKTEVTLSQFNANGIADPIYELDEDDNKILKGVNIFINKDNIHRGEASLHESTGHTYYYISRPDITMENNLYLTSQYMDRVRKIYMIPIRNGEELGNFIINLYRALTFRGPRKFRTHRSLFEDSGESPRHEEEHEIKE